MTDADAVDRFERIVLAQSPASAPWQPVTDYSFEARRIVEGEHPARILNFLVQPARQRILDYGCGPGHLVRLLREVGGAQGLHVMGYDPQFKHCPPIAMNLIGDLPPFGVDWAWDLVICREVLEHCTVQEIATIVPRLCAYSRRLVYVTTRFAKQPDHFLSLDTSDDLDPTHITMLTKPWLRMLFVMQGFRSRPDLETAMDWKHLGRCLVMEKA